MRDRTPTADLAGVRAAVRRFTLAFTAATDTTWLALERFNDTLLGHGTTPPPEPRLLACSEDDPISWWERDPDVGRWHARRCASMLTGEPMTELDLTAVHMRPHDHAIDCDAYNCGGPADACPYEAEGYMREVPADDPRALTAWRAEWVGDIDGTLRRRTQRRLRRRRPCFRPVLWGGRLEHRANRLERVLYGRSTINLPGDRQLQPHHGQVTSLAERRARKP